MIKSSYSKGNEALRKGNYAKAIKNYAEAIVEQPELSKILWTNIYIANKKYQASQKPAAKLKVAVCGWELAHNAAGRVYTLATLYHEFSKVEIIGSIFPRFGKEVWEPIQDTSIPKHTFIVEDDNNFILQAIRLVAAHPYNIVHLSKPRAPNIFFGILYKLIWNAKVIMDIDDQELAFVGAESPAILDDYISNNKKLPSLSELWGKDWTRIAVGLTNYFDGLTVCNTALKELYGGEIIRHARDESLLISSPQLKIACRRKYGISLEKKVILYFGSPKSHKGLMPTAKAVARIQKPEVLFLIVGSFEEEPLKEEIVAVSGLTVSFLPNQPISNSRDILALADCCVLFQDDQFDAARYQTPAKISDALGARVPLVICGSANLNDFISDGFACFCSADNLTESVEKVLYDDLYRKEVLGNASKVFKEHFSLSRNSENIKKYVSKLGDAKNNDARNILRSKFTEHFFPGSLYPLPHSSDEEIKLQSARLIKQIRLSKVEKTLGFLNTIPQNNENNTDSDPRFVVLGNNLNGDKLIKSQPEIGPYFTVIVYAETSGPTLRLTLESLAIACDKYNCWITLVCDWKDSEQLSIPFLGGTHSTTIINSEKKGFYASVSDFIKQSSTKNVLIVRAGAIITEHGIGVLVNSVLNKQLLDVGSPLSNSSPFSSVEIKPGLNINATNTASKYLFNEIVHLRCLVPSFDCFMVTNEALRAIPFPAWSLEQDSTQMSLIRWFQAVNSKGIRVGILPGAYYHWVSDRLIKDNDIREFLDPRSLEYSESILEKDEVSGSRLREIWSLNDPEIRNKVTICFFIQSLTLGGGGLVIANLANHLILLGYDVRVFARHIQKDYKQGFILLFELKQYSKVEHVLNKIPDGALCVATLWTTARDVEEVITIKNDCDGYYYIQDYEPYFYEIDSKSDKERDYYSKALDSYSANLKWIYTSDWIKSQLVSNKHGHSKILKKINVGIDHSIFYPSPDLHSYQRLAGRSITIGAMARPSTPRRGFQLLIKTIELVVKKHSHATIIFFGEDNYDKYKIDFNYVSKGIVHPSQLRALYKSFDIFLDTSDFQGFGLCALEAMSAGCSCVITDCGGIREYAVDGENALIADHNPEILAARVNQLIESPETRGRLSKSARNTALYFDSYRNASNWTSIIHGPRINQVEATSGCAVVVPVFNNMHVVRRCLNSVIKTLREEDILVIIDDHSDSYTAEQLRLIKKPFSNVFLFRNDKNLGFVGASNRGMSFARDHSKDIILLNSDTIVPANWIERLRSAAYQGNVPAIVSPFATESSHLQINLNPGDSFISADSFLNNKINPAFPEIITPEGWCFYLPREIYKEIGFLDTIFGRGYCEESDLCMRAVVAGFKLRCCDNLLVFHQGKVTFGADRSDLYKRNRKVFDMRWSAIYERMYAGFLRADYLTRVRDTYLRNNSYKNLLGDRRFDSITDILHEKVTQSAIDDVAKNKYINLIGLKKIKSVAFLLPEFVPYGGVLSVVSLSNELILHGIDSKIVTLKIDGYSGDNLQSLSPPIFLENYTDLLEHFPKVDLLVATGWITVYYAALILSCNPGLALAYYIQDFEPDFPDIKSDPFHFKAALKTYTLNLPSFCKTNWIREKIRKEVGTSVTLVSPALDLDKFYYRDVAQNESLIDILAMYRPDTEQRDPDTLLRVIKKIKSVRPSTRVAFFGEKHMSEELVRLGVIELSLGRVPNEDLPKIYSRSKIFLETSRFHGFGRTISEAMACGCACVITKSGGPMDFANDEINCLVAEPGDVDELAKKVLGLIDDEVRIRNIKSNARNSVLDFDARKSSIEVMKALNIKLS